MNSEDDEFKRIEREQAMRGVPDAIHHTDPTESLEYIQGWNDCRQVMLAEQPPQRTWVGLTDEERIMCRSYDPEEAVAKTEAKLKEKNT